MSNENLAMEQRIAELEAMLSDKEAKIQDLEQRYGQFFAVLERMPSLAWIKNEEHQLTYLNPAFESAFGISRDDWLHKSGWDLFPREQAAVMAENDQRVFDSGDGFVVMETVTTDREYHYLNYKFPFSSGDGKFIAGISIDISAQLAAEKELQNQVEQLAQLESSKNKFIALLSHDLRSPIAHLVSSADLITEQNLTDLEYINSALTKLRDNGENIIEVLDNLIQWYRDENTHNQIPTSVNIKQQLELACALYEANLKEKNLTLALAADPAIYHSINEAPFATILRNLISNAVKFSPQNGTLTLSARKTDSAIEISIVDQGGGIDQAKLKLLFDNPWVSSPGTANEQGFGFGLGIANELAKKYGWRLELANTSTAGSDFRIIIPLELHN